MATVVLVEQEIEELEAGARADGLPDADLGAVVADLRVEVSSIGVEDHAAEHQLPPLNVQPLAKFVTLGRWLGAWQRAGGRRC
ncbi:MAG: hypothetical protein ACRDRW_17265 [Pseudonocardiaceae bacterium]